MSNASVNWSLRINNGAFVENISRTFSFTQATARGGLPGFKLIGTTEEAIVTTDLVSAGVLFIENLGPTNFISFGVVVAATFYPVGKILVGESYPWRLHPSCALYLKADVAECAVVIRIADA